MTPVKYTLDPNEHPETKDSIEWAEGLTGHKMSTPPREHDKEDKRARYDLNPDEDDDVSETLKSTHQAEIELGYHRLNQNQTVSEYNGDPAFHNSKTYFDDEENQNGKSKKWWKHLEKDRYDGMTYVDQKKERQSDEIEYKGKPLEFEIEGLNVDTPSKE